MVFSFREMSHYATRLPGMTLNGVNASIPVAYSSSVPEELPVLSGDPEVSMTCKKRPARPVLKAIPRTEMSPTGKGLARSARVSQMTSVGDTLIEEKQTMPRILSRLNRCQYCLAQMASCLIPADVRLPTPLCPHGERIITTDVPALHSDHVCCADTHCKGTAMFDSLATSLGFAHTAKVKYSTNVSAFHLFCRQESTALSH